MSTFVDDPSIVYLIVILGDKRSLTIPNNEPQIKGYSTISNSNLDWSLWVDTALKLTVGELGDAQSLHLIVILNLPHPQL